MSVSGSTACTSNTQRDKSLERVDRRTTVYCVKSVYGHSNRGNGLIRLSITEGVLEAKRKWGLPSMHGSTTAFDCRCLQTLAAQSKKPRLCNNPHVCTAGKASHLQDARVKSEHVTSRLGVGLKQQHLGRGWGLDPWAAHRCQTPL